MIPNVEHVADIIKSAAKTVLLPRFAHVEQEIKADGSIVTEADRLMQQQLKGMLSEQWPNIPVLGEEMSAETQQALLAGSEGGLWLLDPLDGTSNFAAGIPYFCVSLALVRNSKVVLAVVYDPVRDECFSAQKGCGAKLNGQSLRPAVPVHALSASMGLIDFKRLHAKLSTRLATAPPYASQRSFGSGALDWCMVAAGRCHLYLHGGQKLWDYAAGQLILTEAGGDSSTLDGDVVFQANLLPRSVVAASSPELFSEWVQWLSKE